MNAGQAWIMTSQGLPRRLEPGSIALVRPGVPHVVARKRGLATVDARRFFSSCASAKPLHLRSGHRGTRTEFITGFYYLEHHERDPLLRSLPSLMVLGESLHPPSVPSGSWKETLSELDRELRQQAPGFLTVASHLTEILLIRLIRAWLTTEAAAGGTGFLAGVAEPSIARALDALQSDLGGGWSVAKLAQCAGLSRTAFATLFSATMGEGPASYTRRVRMQKACELLESTQLSTAQVGSFVGYDSEAAFHRVFSHRVGVTPAQWRRRRRPS